MKPKRKVLKNGMRVILVPMKDNQTATTMVLTNVGSHAEKEDEFGLAHFLEHMMFKATKKRTSSLELILEIEHLGARTNAFTSKSYTGYYITGAAKHAHKMLNIVSDVYLNPAFPESEVDKEKGVVIEELNMYEDTPQDLVDLKWDQLMFGDMTPAGRPIIGTKKSVTALTRDHLVAFHKKHYTAANTVVVVAGNFDERKIMDDIKKYFSELPAGSLTKQPKPKVMDNKIRALDKKSEQTHLVLGVPGLARTHKDHLNQSMLVSVLGSGMSSRLFHKLREDMGVCYYVYASANVYPSYGSITFHAGIPAARLEEVVIALRAELERIATETVPEDELTKTKNYVAGSFVLGLESSRSLAQYYGMQEVMGLDLKAPKERMKLIMETDARDIKRLARKLFTPDKMYLALVGPVRKAQALKKLLK